MAKAVALFSGGLDSTLAILTILQQGIEVTAVKFLTNFEFIAHKNSSYSKNLYYTARKFGFDLDICDLQEKFIDIVLNPKHGYGKNMNPCVDCRILMLKEIKKILDQINAEFIITGEVLGQRPMSQRKDMLYHIGKEAGVTGYVIRPLSAKLLKITIPEEKGILNRQMLFDFSGRSRKKQMAFADKFGLKDYPTPAGGCLLTEPNFAHRLRDLLRYNPTPSSRDIDLLKVGRHFQHPPSCKIIVGRDKSENEIIESLSKDKDYLLKIEGCGSPTALVRGEITDEALKIAASICARYSDAKNLSSVEVTASKGGRLFSLKVQPAKNSLLENYRIEEKSKVIS